MKPGTTPTHTFKLSINPEFLKDVRVIYSVKGKIVLSKSLSDGIFTGDSFVVNLTQEDTLRFAHGTIADVQLRVITNAGDVLSTEVMKMSIEECLDREVLK